MRPRFAVCLTRIFTFACSALEQSVVVQISRSMSFQDTTEFKDNQILLSTSQNVPAMFANNPLAAASIVCRTSGRREIHLDCPESSTYARHNFRVR